MKLIDKIDEKYKNSIKEKDSNSINTLRLIRSAIKDRLISLRGKQDNLSDRDSIINITKFNKTKKRLN